SPPVRSCPKDPPGLELPPCEGTFSCTYGDHPDWHCRDLLECRDGTWLLTTATCELPPSCFEQPPYPVIGTPCESKGAWCEYSDHAPCACVPCTGLSCA
ncbi:MAG: hypothetical protein FJ104_06605, partial [Deltaproteobacteria bacterium]|nr:hypothetical protein [Deltaproteobacteria bacterium]